MDKRSKYLLWGFVLLTIAVAGWGYKVFFIERNFVVDSTTVCDPQVESCFMWCESGECEIDYYAKITKRAYNIPICNGAVEECEPLVCTSNEEGCEILYCSGDTAQDNEVCTNPKDFQIESQVIIPASTEPVM